MSNSQKNQLLVTWPSLLLLIFIIIVHTIFKNWQPETIVVGGAVLFLVLVLIPMANNAEIHRGSKKNTEDPEYAHHAKSLESHADMLFAFSFSIYLSSCQLLYSMNGFRALISIPFLMVGGSTILELSRDKRINNAFIGQNFFRRLFVVLLILMAFVLAVAIATGEWKFIYFL